jgi:cell division protein FtsI/penicillin-binding protein 2
MNQKVFKRRVYAAGFLFAALSLVFIVRLAHLHFSGRVVVSDGEKSEVRRGSISDRSGYILALSLEKDSLFANPEEIKNQEETARLLSGLLQVPRESILKKFKKKKRFIWIKRKIDDPVAEKIRKIGIPGLYLKKEYKRMYPHDGLASNIIGFTGIDNNGLAGIEYAFDGALSTPAESAGTKQGGGNFGKNITLTIDRLIQHEAEQEIERAVSIYRAKQGAVLVMEVKTGRILAMAKAPGFNPNRYYEYPPFSLRNFSFIDSFEPGSTMKILSLASMLEHNPRVTELRYLCKGSIDIADVTINCTGVHGSVSMKDIIRHSCNVGVIEATKGIKKKDLFDSLAKFRFGRKTGVELPGETEGILRHWKKWSGLSKYSIAIGQEVSVTALQLATAFCAVANGGVYISPAIIESIEEQDGTVLRGFRPAVRGRIISKSISEKLMNMMRGVVEGGTGQKAASRYYCVAGKTGTSQKFVRAKGYSERVVASFIGIAPCEDPSVCMLVIIDDPADRLSGGQIATPVFANLIDRVLVRQGVVKKRLKPDEPVRMAARKIEFDGDTMPDFRGHGMAESLAALVEIKKRREVIYSLKGTGRVYAQEPAPGARLEKAAEIKLLLKE